jgi:hypothetical protein
VKSEKSNGLVNTAAAGKTAYAIPPDMKELFALSLPACE